MSGATTTPKPILGLTVPGFPNFFILTARKRGSPWRNQIFHDRMRRAAHDAGVAAELLEGGKRSIECRPISMRAITARSTIACAHGVDAQGHDQLVPQPHGRVFAITPGGWSNIGR